MFIIMSFIHTCTFLFLPPNAIIIKKCHCRSFELVACRRLMAHELNIYTFLFDIFLQYHLSKIYQTPPCLWKTFRYILYGVQEVLGGPNNRRWRWYCMFYWFKTVKLSYYIIILLFFYVLTHLIKNTSKVHSTYYFLFIVSLFSLLVSIFACVCVFFLFGVKNNNNSDIS